MLNPRRNEDKCLIENIPQSHPNKNTNTLYEESNVNRPGGHSDHVGVMGIIVRIIIYKSFECTLPLSFWRNLILYKSEGFPH